MGLFCADTAVGGIPILRPQTGKVLEQRVLTTSECFSGTVAGISEVCQPVDTNAVLGYAVASRQVSCERSVDRRRETTGLECSGVRREQHSR